MLINFWVKKMTASEFVNEIKKEYPHLTDEDLGKAVGLKGQAFAARRRKGNLTVWQLKRIITKYNVNKDLVLEFLGIKADPMEKKIMSELKDIKKLIKESQPESLATNG